MVLFFCGLAYNSVGVDFWIALNAICDLFAYSNIRASTCCFTYGIVNFALYSKFPPTYLFAMVISLNANLYVKPDVNSVVLIQIKSSG